MFYWVTQKRDRCTYVCLEGLTNSNQTVPRTRAVTIPKTGHKEMGTNGLWNWRLTVPKTIKMMLVRPLMTNLKMTVRDDCAVSACSPPPLTLLMLSPTPNPLLVWAGGWGKVSLWTDACRPPPTVAGTWNKPNFPFHQPGLFTDFWMASSQVPNAHLSVTEGHWNPPKKETPCPKTKKKPQEWDRNC